MEDSSLERNVEVLRQRLLDTELRALGTTDLPAAPPQDGGDAGGTELVPRTDEQIRAVIRAVLSGGDNITLTYDSVTNTLSISAAGHTPRTDEEIRDTVATFLRAGKGINLAHDDAGDALTVASTVTPAGGANLGEKTTQTSFGGTFQDTGIDLPSAPAGELWMLLLIDSADNLYPPAVFPASVLLNSPPLTTVSRTSDGGIEVRLQSIGLNIKIGRTAANDFLILTDSNLGSIRLYKLP